MVKIKIWSKRLLMTILFIIALLSTLQVVTGIKPEDLSGLQIETNHPFAWIGNVFSQGNQPLSKAAITVNSQMTEEVPSLEEAFNWEEYPSTTVVATGYTAGYESTGKNPGDPSYGITYSGVKVKRDLYSTIAADLDIFPIGTILFIPGYGYGVVADKGSAIKGNKIDLYFETVEDVYNEWGKKTIDVYVIKMGDGSLTNEELLALNEDESMQVFRTQYGFKTKE